MKDKMTWEETIQYIRTQPDYKYLVEKAYFEEDLPLNVERFRKENEYKETLKKLKEYAPNGKKILDIGSGNGISAISFAIDGYEVTTVEPDPSETIGAGAIRKLKEFYKLENIVIHEAFAEEINFKNETFDVVYARQCMHHAYDLQKFVGEMSRVLKKDGLFFTVRDHVIFNEKDKEKFLENHPLQKFYGGENAFTTQEYRYAIEKSGLLILEELKFYDSEINYFPETQQEIENKKNIIYQNMKYKNIMKFLPSYKKRKIQNILNYSEKNISGRMYSYIATKK